MTTKRIQLNGTNYYPTSIEVEIMKIEDADRMANGTLRTWFRAHKQRWTLTWDGLPETLLASIRGVYTTTTSFVLVDEFDTSYTVLSRNCTYELSAARISIAGMVYYDVTLELEEV